MIPNDQPSARGNLSAELNPPDRVPHAVGEAFNVHASAELQADGTLRVTISGSTTYGTLGRKTSVTIDVTDDLGPETIEAITGVLHLANALGRDRLARRLARDAQLAVSAAIRDPDDPEQEEAD